MITRFKLFEELKKEPQRGDYVICAHKYWTPTNNEQFLANIGQIISHDYNNRFNVRYEIELKNPNERNSMGRSDWLFYENEILYCSKNKADLEPIAQLNADSNKFGI